MVQVTVALENMVEAIANGNEGVIDRLDPCQHEELRQLLHTAKTQALAEHQDFGRQFQRLQRTAPEQAARIAPDQAKAKLWARVINLESAWNGLANPSRGGDDLDE